jgi:hypothetical protein
LVNEGSQGGGAGGREVEAVGGGVGHREDLDEEALGEEDDVKFRGEAALDAAVGDFVREQWEFEHHERAVGSGGSLKQGAEVSFEVGGGKVGDEVIAADFQQDERVVEGEFLGQGKGVFGADAWTRGWWWGCGRCG